MHRHASIACMPRLRFSRKATSLLLAAGALVAGSLVAVSPSATGARPSASPGPQTQTPRVLLALGDSLAAGYQPADGRKAPPTDPATGFPDQGYPGSYPADVARRLGLGLVDLACPGETTTSMSSTPAEPACATAYRGELGAASQLAAARSYLGRHRGEVSLVTLDIGANDVDACLSSASVDLACLARARTGISSRLPRILDSLRAALAVDDPGARLVAMNYYDPFLAAAYRPGGAKGAAEAALSVVVADGFNAILASIYHRYRVPVANVAGAFHTGTVIPLLSYGGRTLPADVAYVCRWTWMCPVSSNIDSADIHPDASGYSAIANAFEKILLPR